MASRRMRSRSPKTNQWSILKSHHQYAIDSIPALSMPGLRGPWFFSGPGGHAAIHSTAGLTVRMATVSTPPTILTSHIYRFHVPFPLLYQSFFSQNKYSSFLLFLISAILLSSRGSRQSYILMHHIESRERGKLPHIAQNPDSPSHWDTTQSVSVQCYSIPVTHVFFACRAHKLLDFAHHSRHTSLR